VISAYLLVRAGYPFAKDELDPADWRLIGIMDVIIRKAELKEAISQYNVSMNGSGMKHEREE